MRLTESLIFLSFIHRTQYSAEPSKPSHHRPFISPPAEFIISDSIIPPSPLQLFVFRALRDPGPIHSPFHYLGHRVFPSTHFFLPTLLCLPSLCINPRPPALISSVIYTFPRQYVLLIQCPAQGTASLHRGRDMRGHT